MRRSKKTLLGVVVSVLGLISTSSPAGASTAGTVTFTGFLDISCGLGYPVISPPRTCTIGIPRTTTCADVVGGKNVTAGLCAFWGIGTVTGHCEASSGVLWGEVNTSDGKYVSYHGNLTISGGAVTATGTVTYTGQTGVITIDGYSTPVPSMPEAPSCITGTRTEWFLVGEATFATTDPL